MQSNNLIPVLAVCVGGIFLYTAVRGEQYGYNPLTLFKETLTGNFPGQDWAKISPAQSGGGQQGWGATNSGPNGINDWGQVPATQSGGGQNGWY